MNPANTSTIEIYIQATIAIFMIVNPIDPVKIIIFNDVVRRQDLDRRKATVRVASSVSSSSASSR